MSDGDGRQSPRSPVEWLKWFWNTDHGAVVYAREILQSVAAVVLVGLLLFAVSGIWPPMVAVESGSMEPHMERGDLVFVMEEHRLAPDFAYAETGVVTYRIGQKHGYTKFKQPGDVVVYEPGGNGLSTPIIHRAMFWVNESENWYDKARAVDEGAVGGASSCQELEYCPAPHGGFITKGDNDGTNAQYDQLSNLSPPVKPAWIIGTAEFRIPWLGNIRLWAAQVGPTTGGSAAALDVSDALVRAGSATAGPEADGPIAASTSAPSCPFGASDTSTQAAP